MPNNNARSSKSAGSSRRSAFYALLIAVVVIGGGIILYQMRSSKTDTAPVDEQAAMQALQQRYAKAGPPQPYVLGDTNAPVVIEEFADFECPSCAHFATLTEPDVRKRIVEAGLASYKYYDFPLPMHKNTEAASMSAACAAEQGKFWEMHDALFNGQNDWGLSPSGGEMTDNPKPIFAGYAKTIGLNTTQWEQCFDTKKYQSRIDANAAEAVRRNVQSTPTFFINGTKKSGAMPYDEMKRLVDEAAKAGPASAADSAMNNMVKH